MQTWDIVHRSAFSLSCQSNSSNLQYAISIQDTWRVPVIGPFLYFFGTSRNLSLGGKKQTRGERVREKREQDGGKVNAYCGVWCGCNSHIFGILKKENSDVNCLSNWISFENNNGTIFTWKTKSYWKLFHKMRMKRRHGKFNMRFFLNVVVSLYL